MSTKESPGREVEVVWECDAKKDYEGRRVMVMEVQGIERRR